MVRRSCQIAVPLIEGEKLKREASASSPTFSNPTTSCAKLMVMDDPEPITPAVYAEMYSLKAGSMDDGWESVPGLLHDKRQTERIAMTPVTDTRGQEIDIDGRIRLFLPS